MKIYFAIGSTKQHNNALCMCGVSQRLQSYYYLNDVGERDRPQTPQELRLYAMTGKCYNNEERQEAVETLLEEEYEHHLDVKEAVIERRRKIRKRHGL